VAWTSGCIPFIEFFSALAAMNDAGAMNRTAHAELAVAASALLSIPDAAMNARTTGI
jgi:hypothetical protein